MTNQNLQNELKENLCLSLQKLISRFFFVYTMVTLIICTMVTLIIWAAKGSKTEKLETKLSTLQKSKSNILLQRLGDLIN